MARPCRVATRPRTPRPSSSCPCGTALCPWGGWLPPPGRTSKIPSAPRIVPLRFPRLVVPVTTLGSRLRRWRVRIGRTLTSVANGRMFRCVTSGRRNKNPRFSPRRSRDGGRGSPFSVVRATGSSPRPERGGARRDRDWLDARHSPRAFLPPWFAGTPFERTRDKPGPPSWVQACRGWPGPNRTGQPHHPRRPGTEQGRRPGASRRLLQRDSQRRRGSRQGLPSPWCRSPAPPFRTVGNPHRAGSARKGTAT